MTPFPLAPYLLQLKPDYSGGAEIDCLIIGAVFGTNRNKGTVSEFILALAVPPEDPMQVSVGRAALMYESINVHIIVVRTSGPATCRATP